MLSASLLAVPLLVASGQTGVLFGASARTEARARPHTTFVAGQQQDSVGLDLDVTPGLEVGLRAELLRLTLTYTPRLTLRELIPAVQPELLHQASLRAEVPLSTDTRIFATQELAYGQQDYGSLTSLLNEPATPAAGQSAPPPTTQAPLPGGALQPLPGRVTVRAIASTSSVGFFHIVTPRVLLGMNASYFFTGGANRAAQATVPLQRGPRVDAAVGYLLTPIDTLLTAASATHITFTTGPRPLILELTESWQRQLDPASQLSLSAGASGVSTLDLTTRTRALGVTPIGRAQWSRRLDTRQDGAQLNAGAEYAPFVDRLTGTVSERFQLSGGGSLSLDPDTRFAGTGSWSWVVAGPERHDRLFATELSLGRRLADSLMLDGGVRLAWQQQPARSRETFFQWVAFVGMSWRESRL
jgi:hypothetical protein